jgi:hypothetical protein
MPAQRTSLLPPNEVWKTLSNEEKKRINKEEDNRVKAVNEEDEQELLRRIDKAGPTGYRLPDADPNDTEKTKDAVAMLLASMRLSGFNSDVFDPKTKAVTERAPFVLVRVDKGK